MKKITFSLLGVFIAAFVFAQSSSNPMSVTPGKSRNYKRAITTRPFGPLIGFVSLGYQQAFSPTRSIVGEVGLIGPHIGDFRDKEAHGGFVKVGFRLKRTPEVVTSDMEWGHNLGGFYVQPEIAYSSYRRNFYSTTDGVSTSGRFRSGAFMIGVGRQMIVGELLTFDLGASLGYAFTKKPEGAGFEGFDIPRQYYSHMAGGDRFPVAWKINFTMGVLLK